MQYSALPAWIVMIASTAAAQNPVWDLTLGQPGFDQNNVSAIHVWDPDGDGPMAPQLIVGGSFTSSGGQPLHYLARWTGTHWEQLGPPLSEGGAVTQVNALATWDPDGPGPAQPLLIVGGNFSTDGTSTLNNIAAWNGTQFLPLGSGIGMGGVYALLSWDPDGPGPANDLLIIGGQFASPFMRVCAWNGTSYAALGGGLPDNVFMLAAWDPDGTGPANSQIIAGGSMPAPSPRIVRFDGAAWQPMGAGFTSGVLSFVASYDADGDGPANPLVLAGGSILASGSTALNRLAYWAGTGWTPFGSFDGFVRSGVMFDPDGSGPFNSQLYLFGQFTSPAVNAVRWTGREFVGVPGSEATGAVLRTASYDPDGDGPLPPQIIVGGTFTMMGDQPAGRIAALGFPGTPEPCPGDLNGDNVVNSADLSVLLSNFGNACQK